LRPTGRRPLRPKAFPHAPERAALGTACVTALRRQNPRAPTGCRWQPRDQSRTSASESSSSINRCSRSHTPAACHSRSRRHAVCPDPKAELRRQVAPTATGAEDRTRCPPARRGHRSSAGLRAPSPPAAMGSAAPATQQLPQPIIDQPLLNGPRHGHKASLSKIPIAPQRHTLSSETRSKPIPGAPEPASGKCRSWSTRGQVPAAGQLPPWRSTSSWASRTPLCLIEAKVTAAIGWVQVGCRCGSPARATVPAGTPPWRHSDGGTAVPHPWRHHRTSDAHRGGSRCRRTHTQ